MRTNILTASILYNLYGVNYSSFARRGVIGEHYGRFAAAFLRGAVCESN